MFVGLMSKSWSSICPIGLTNLLNGRMDCNHTACIFCDHEYLKVMKYAQWLSLGIAVEHISLKQFPSLASYVLQVRG